MKKINYFFICLVFVTGIIQPQQNVYSFSHIWKNYKIPILLTAANIGFGTLIALNYYKKALAADNQKELSSHKIKEKAHGLIEKAVQKIRSVWNFFKKKPKPTAQEPTAPEQKFLSSYIQSMKETTQKEQTDAIKSLQEQTPIANPSWIRLLPKIKETEEEKIKNNSKIIQEALDLTKQEVITIAELKKSKPLPKLEDAIQNKHSRNLFENNQNNIQNTKTVKVKPDLKNDKETNKNIGLQFNTVYNDFTQNFIKQEQKIFEQYTQQENFKKILNCEIYGNIIKYSLARYANKLYYYVINTFVKSCAQNTQMSSSDYELWALKSYDFPKMKIKLSISLDNTIISKETMSTFRNTLQKKLKQESQQILQETMNIIATYYKGRVIGSKKMLTKLAVGVVNTLGTQNIYLKNKPIFHEIIENYTEQLEKTIQDFFDIKISKNESRSETIKKIIQAPEKRQPKETIKIKQHYSQESLKEISRDVIKIAQERTKAQIKNTGQDTILNIFEEQQLTKFIHAFENRLFTSISQWQKTKKNADFSAKYNTWITIALNPKPNGQHNRELKKQLPTLKKILFDKGYKNKTKYHYTKQVIARHASFIKGRITKRKLPYCENSAADMYKVIRKPINSLIQS